MSDGWKIKKEKRMKRNQKNNQISKWSILDFLINLAEIIIWPIRLVFWIVRGIGRAIANFFDGL